MEVRFTQLTDIHLGGDYDGMFSTMENFRQVLLSAKDDSYLVITGDLADTDHEKNYMFIKDAVEAKFGQRYAVLPGNHDDVAILRDVFAGHTESFYHEGVPVSLIPTIWDPSAGKDVGIGQLDLQCKNKMMLGQSLVFTHYPVFDTMHKFMNKHALSRSSKDAIIKMMKESRSNVLFCGHFHDCVETEVTTQVSDTYDMQSGLSNYTSSTFTQYICPAVQCQIDRVSDSFVCSSKLPNGFSITVRGIPDRLGVSVTRLFHRK